MNCNVICNQFTFNLDITYQIYTGKPEDFNKNDLAPSDAITVYGAPKDVTNYIDKTLKQSFVNDWGGENNPGTTVTNISGISPESISKMAKTYGSDFNTVATFVTLHESGHPGRGRYGDFRNNDHTYNMNNSLSWKGKFSIGYLHTTDSRYNSFNAQMNKDNNSGYIESMQKFYNAGYSRDNMKLRKENPYYRYKRISSFMSTLLNQP